MIEAGPLGGVADVWGLIGGDEVICENGYRTGIGSAKCGNEIGSLTIEYGAWYIGDPLCTQ